MNKIAAILLAGVLAISACGNMSSQQRYASGGLAGGAAGLAVADMLDADDTVKVIGTLLGAAAGSSYASGGGYNAYGY